MLFGSIVAVVVIMYAAQFSRDLFDPGLSSTSTPTLAPTGTSAPTHTLTSTPTPTPTDTLTPAISPTATVTPLSAPVLLEPEEGILFGAADNIVLAWRWYHRLQPRDVFSVGLLREGEEPMTLAWHRETQLTVDMQRFLPETGHPMILPVLKEFWFFHRTPRHCYGTTRVEATSLRRIEGARDFTFQDQAFSIQVGLGNWYG